MQSDTETDVSSSSMHMNNVWSEEEQSSLSDDGNQNEEPEIQVATITPLEHVADITSATCPIHGIQNVPNPVMTDGNKLLSLQDTVKTYLLSSDYPHDITLDMINRFCSVPLKRLVVKITEPERLKPIPDFIITDCVIKLHRLTVVNTPENQSEATSSDDTPEIDEPTTKSTEDPIMTDGNDVNITLTRPKRNGTQIKSYVESNSEEDAINTTQSSPKPKRSVITLRSPSATRIAAQKSKKKIIKPLIPTPSSPPMTRSRTSNTIYVPPKLRPRNTKEKHKNNKTRVKSATPAKPTPKPTPAKVKPKGDLDIKFKGLSRHKKPRKFTCKECEKSFVSQALLNAHHIHEHQPVKCPDCIKIFIMPSTLARHSYIHKPLKY